MPPHQCLGALKMLLAVYNFLIGCPLIRKTCLGAVALSKTKHTGLWCTKFVVVLNRLGAAMEEMVQPRPEPLLWCGFVYGVAKGFFFATLWLSNALIKLILHLQANITMIWVMTSVIDPPKNLWRQNIHKRATKHGLHEGTTQWRKPIFLFILYFL